MLSSVFRRFSSSAAEGAATAITKAAIANVSRIILTASCKGGVGKSTVALNTAIALSKTGAKVGLFDADVYGPSIPHMVKTTEEILHCDKDTNFQPVETYGIQTASIANCTDKNSALIWKGPLLAQFVSELLRKGIWAKLDYLVVDTPPGTGDVHMTLAQTFPIDGAILVTTPQLVSVADVARSIDAFKQFQVPILGLIENFGSFVCDGCKTATKLFPGNGSELLSSKYSIPVLGSLPVDPEIAAAGDGGVPAVLHRPDSECAKVFAGIADTILSLLPIKAAQ
jgi:ATP-binding protein involved in chromosome partitioning